MDDDDRKTRLAMEVRDLFAGRDLIERAESLSGTGYGDLTSEIDCLLHDACVEWWRVAGMGGLFRNEDRHWAVRSAQTWCLSHVDQVQRLTEGVST